MGFFFDRLLTQKEGVDAARHCLKRTLCLHRRGNGEDGWTPLTVASLFDQLERVEFLLDEAGVDVNATNEWGESALHRARTSEMASVLVSRGANVDARDGLGRTSLHEACFLLRVELVRVLLQANADVSIADNDGKLPMEYTSQRIASDANALGAGLRILQDLIRHGAEWDPKYETLISSFRDEEAKLRWERVAPAIRCVVDVWTEEQRRGHPLSDLSEEEVENDLEAIQIYMKERTMANRLIKACNEGDVDAVRRLLKSGLDINACGAEEFGWTPLTIASVNDHIEVVKFLLVEAGVDASAMSAYGESALHLSQSSEIASLLTSRGADVDARDIVGRTPLHKACRSLQTDVVKILLEANANVSIENNNGELPIENALVATALTQDSLGDGLSIIQDLIRHGAEWDPKYETLGNFLKEEDKQRWERIVLALEFVIDLWTEELLHGLLLTDIPEEEIEKGLEATQIYVKDRKASKLIVCRRPICVVGPSTAGKTSLIKSLIGKAVCLEKVEERTIGIDHFTLKFNEPTTLAVVPRTHEVKFSDFAGQNVYQVMHSLFFTKRTLFMLCIDLNAYSIMLLRSEMLTPDETRMQHLMNEYVDRIVLSWIRIILARQSDAEFVFVCTKEDTVSSGPGVDEEEVLAHMEMMLGRVMAIVKDIKDDTARKQAMSKASGDQKIATEHECRALKKRQERKPLIHLWDPRLKKVSKPTFSIVVTDSTTAVSVQRARSQLEKLIVESGKSYETPETYMAVLRRLEERKTALRDFSIIDRVTDSFVDVDELITELQADVAGLEEVETVKRILRTLRDCVDILWYEDVQGTMLETTVILDPSMVIEFLRQVINHKHATGVIDHSKLSGLPYWTQLKSDTEAMLAMKKLLQTFRLAHPADGEMSWSSDPIVPTYWKTNQRAVWKFGGEKLRLDARGMDVESVSRRVHWEFRFTHFIPETLFDHLVVATYLPSLPLEVGPDWLLYRDGQLAACRVMVSRNWETHERSLLVEAVVTVDHEATTLWTIFSSVCDALASVLKEHPGLAVTSCAHSDVPGHKPSLASILYGMDRTTVDTTWMPPTPVASVCVRSVARK